MARTITINDKHRLALNIPEVEMLAQAMYMISSAVHAGNLDKEFWIGDRAELARWGTLRNKLEMFHDHYNHEEEA